MAYRHGIYVTEQPTGVTPPLQIEGNTGLTVAFGVSPTHLATTPAKPNTPILTNYYTEAVKQLGYHDDFERWTLCEVMSAQFVLYNVAPVVFVNVFDVDKHFNDKSFTAQGIGSTPANLGLDAILGTLKVTSGLDKDPDVLTANSDYQVDEVEDVDEDTITKTLQILSVANVTDDTVKISYKTSRDTDTTIISARTVEVGTEIVLDSDTVISTVKLESGGSVHKDLVEDVDYNAARDSDGSVIVTLIDDEKVVDDTIKIAYHEAAPEKVTEFDIIGGVDTLTNEITGLELVEVIYPRLGVLPGIIIAPKYSTNSAVAAVMKAKARLVNETFKATAIVDIDSDDAGNYTQAAQVKTLKNLVDSQLFICYPKVSLDGVQYHLSTHLAALINQVDANHGGVPYVSPSNHLLQCDSTVKKDGSEIYLGLPQANYLNGNGIITALNHAGAWRCWGSRTSIYPSASDPKESFISVRRVFNWIANSLIVSFFSRIDNPANRRLIESIVTSANIWLDSLTSSGAILGGRVEFSEEDNTTADLLDGKLNFKVYIAPPIPAKEINFILEYDVNYLSTLFA